MKSLLKFTLLSALIIGGRLAKQSAPAAVAQKAPVMATSDSSVVLVHQVLTSEPVPATQEREKVQPQQSGNGLIAEMF